MAIVKENSKNPNSLAQLFNVYPNIRNPCE